MFVRILIFVSIGLQVLAAVLAITLLRRTKYNVAWGFFSVAFIIMAVSRLFDVVAHEKLWSPIEINLFLKWLSVITSVFILAGTIFIRKIFNFLDRIERLRKENESRMLNAIIRTEEKEREQFAKDLHDGMGPLLASAKMSLSALPDEGMPSSGRRIIENTRAMVDEAIASLKEISNHLSPHILTNFGLVRAIQSYAGKLDQLQVLRIGIDNRIGNKRFNYNIEVVIYRVMTELITNALKHSGATRVDISFRTEDDQLLVVDYADDGRGFDPAEALNRLSGGGMGYDNINTRLRSIMARMDLRSAPGEGLVVRIEAPYF